MPIAEYEQPYGSQNPSYKGPVPRFLKQNFSHKVPIPRMYQRRLELARRHKKKPGPKPTIVRLKFYLLPEGDALPKLTRKDEAIEKHQNDGFGYPAMYYSDFKGKRFPVKLSITSEEMVDLIRSLYPRLKDKEFCIFTVDNTRQLIPAPFEPHFFKRIHYQGTVIIKIQGDIAVEPKAEIPDPETDPE